MRGRYVKSHNEEIESVERKRRRGESGWIQFE